MNSGASGGEQKDTGHSNRDPRNFNYRNPKASNNQRQWQRRGENYFSYQPPPNNVPTQQYPPFNNYYPQVNSFPGVVAPGYHFSGHNDGQYGERYAYNVDYQNVNNFVPQNFPPCQPSPFNQIPNPEYSGNFVGVSAGHDNRLPVRPKHSFGQQTYYRNTGQEQDSWNNRGKNRSFNDRQTGNERVVPLNNGARNENSERSYSSNSSNRRTPSDERNFQADNRSDSRYHNRQGNFTKYAPRRSANDERSDECSSKNGAASDGFKESKAPTREENASLERTDDPNEAMLTLKDRMTDQLTSGTYECMVCCEMIRQTSPIWSCSKCYHCFHLYCIKKWAGCENAIVAGGKGWRCPGCQDTVQNVPNRYMCFCGKKRSPFWNRQDPPHTCGEICKKSLKGTMCPHFCSSACHPGPCDSCTLTVKMKCECGKSEQVIRCGQKEYVTCTSICNKNLNCGVHRCQVTCHLGKCEECPEVIKQGCYCGESSREVECSVDNVNQLTYSCESICDKPLSCGAHKCEMKCHQGDCKPCKLTPDVVTRCSCGKMSLEDIYEAGNFEERTSCTAPIPSCGEICNKVLPCGSEGDHHRCQEVCHDSRCPPCPLISSVNCQCEFQVKEIACAELGEKPVTCDKRCNKKLSCKRHKCLKNCCTKTEHTCDLVCERRLSCQKHNCIEPCHRGDCQTCWQVSFDELHCHCGAAVIYPPIPCGTKPPECSEVCARQHPCNHQIQHNCHSDEDCPPCTFLTTKWCYGKHELRKSVPCYLEYISCGKPCGKLLDCRIHKCMKTCHSGECNDEKCGQMCTKPRNDCQHPCGLSCHAESECPPSACKFKVTVSCECGRRKEQISCIEYNNPYISTAKIAIKANDIRCGKSVNLKEIMSKEKRLECDVECAAVSRNRQLALALQIQNPDISSKLNPPPYNDWLKEQTRSNFQFVNDVLDKLTKLVMLAKESKHKSRSNAFPAGKRDNRRIIHELAECYGCESHGVDDEPNRMVIVTAVRDKCWIPSTSIITVVNREMGIRKVPPPIAPGSSKSAGKTLKYFSISDNSKNKS